MLFLKTKLSKLTISLIALVFFFNLGFATNFSWKNLADSLVFIPQAQAGTPIPVSDNCGLSPIKAGPYTISSSCTISGVTGISGTLSITGAATTVTLGAGAQLIMDPGQTITLIPPKSNAMIYIGGSGGKILHGSICIADADGDGYATNGALFYFNAGGTCPAGSSKKSVLITPFEYDCNDGVAGQGCTSTGYLDWDKDGDGAGAYGTYTPSASYNISVNNYDCDDSNATIKNGWSSTSFCGVGTCGGSGTDSCSLGVRNNTCTTSAKLCCNPGVGTYKAAQTPISTCLKCNGTQGDPVNQTSSEDLSNVCTTGATGSGNSCTAANCSGGGDSCGALANGTVCNYGAYTGWTGGNGACFAYRSRNYYTCSGGSCSASVAGTDYDANQNASVGGNVWNGSTWTAASCSSYCNIQTAYCSGQTLARGVFGCNTTGSCDNVTVRASCPPGGCAGGENSRCVGSACVNSCADGLDNDGDTFIDGQDTDCGGSGQCTSGACCNTANGQFKTNATICSPGSFNSPASGSCQRVATDQYCSGSAATCSGTTLNRYENAPVNNNIWNGSSWVASTNAIYCGSSGANTCSGQTVQKDAYGCNTSGSCGASANGYKLNTGTICSGAENDLCQTGSCINKCVQANASYPGDDNANGLTDYQEPNCAACTSGACCDIATGAYRSSSYTCRGSVDTCDAPENCTGSSNACPGDSKYNGNLCRNSVDTCDSADYCNGVANACTDNKVANGTLCRGASDTCDATDYCNGSSNSCADAVIGNGVVCRNSVGSCDATDYCNGAAKTCADGKVGNGTVCNTGAWSGFSNSAGSCFAQRSQPYYTCSSGTCSGSVAGYYYDNSYGSSGQVWNGSAWAAATYANKCGTNGTYSCSGTTSIQLGYYGCNGANSCNVYMGTGQSGTCSGAENTMCVSGYSTCQNACLAPWYSADNNGNGFNDLTDAACGGCGQCTSGTCCNTGNGCFYGTGTVCSSGAFTCLNSCTLRATDTNCPGNGTACSGSASYRYNYGSAGQICSGSAFTAGNTGNYCGRTNSPNSCSGAQPQDNAYYCNGASSCNSTGAALTYGSACTGGTPYCVGGACKQCTIASQCGTDSWIGNYTCSGTNVVNTRRVWSCNSNVCSYVDNPNTVYQNCAATSQICLSGACWSDCPAGNLSATYGSAAYPLITNGSFVDIDAGYKSGGSCGLRVQCTNGSVSVTRDVCTCRCYYRQSGSTYANTVCTACGAGYYGTYDGQTSCTLCEAGYYCPDGGCTTPPNGAGYGRLACPYNYNSAPGSTALGNCVNQCGINGCDINTESCGTCPADCTCQQVIVCGNGICEYGEDGIWCPSDCADCNASSWKQSICGYEPDCYWDALYNPRCRYLWEVM